MPRQPTPTVLILALLAACASAESSGTTADTATAGTGATAAADLVDAQGRSMGTVRLAEIGDGVRVIAELRDLPPGEHGFHVHAVGACEPTFEAAGDHFNPEGNQHGLLNPQGPHAGDLENLSVDAEGRGELQDITDRITLSEGPTSVFDADGSAIMVHAQPDDQRTDPGGGSGERIACGVIERT